MGLTKVRRKGAGKKTNKLTTRGNVHLSLESIETLLLKPNYYPFHFQFFAFLRFSVEEILIKRLNRFSFTFEIILECLLKPVTLKSNSCT